MSATDEAARTGIDLSLIDESLRLTPEQRAIQHQAALEMALQLEAAYRAREHDGNKSPSAETLRR
jgi:hypothetical protein